MRSKPNEEGDAKKYLIGRDASVGALGWVGVDLGGLGGVFSFFKCGLRVQEAWARHHLQVSMVLSQSSPLYCHPSVTVALVCSARGPSLARGGRREGPAARICAHKQGMDVD